MFGCNAFVCGDFNARTATRSDYVDNDSVFIADLLPDDYIIDQSLPRSSEDSICNEYGTCLLEMCKASGLRILNGRLGEDKYTGKFTCVKGNGKSVVDYVLCKQDLFSMVSNFVIDEPNILSDHCTVRFSLTARHNLRNINGTDESSKCHSYTYKWDDVKKAEYIDRLGQSHIIDKLQSTTDRLSYIETEADLHDSNSNNNKSNLNQPWFDDNCKFKRKEFYENLNFYRIDKSEENRIHSPNQGLDTNVL